MTYKYTLNLPSNKFKMKANLKKMENNILKYWNSINLYNFLKKSRISKKKFSINDGPPYANGLIHLGHALNKVLKDIINKFYILSNFNVIFIPGWDCHGLPIEINIEKKIKKSKIKPIEFRNKCREYALKQVSFQKKSFVRLGIYGDWDNAYKTMDFEFESTIINSLRIIVKKKYIYLGKKPIYWCFFCKSALAEAEVEYNDKISHSLYINFKLSCHDNMYKHINNGAVINFIVWTTMPWTLLFNETIAVNSNYIYTLIKYNNQYYILECSLLSKLVNIFNYIDYIIITNFKGKFLFNKKVFHPFLKKSVYIILSNHVRNDIGSGCVHIAPSHGHDDFNIATKYNLPINNYIDNNGYYFGCNSKYLNMYIYNMDVEIIKKLKINLNLLFYEELKHRYPNCWRHKNPVIYRTTKQWFINVSKNSLLKKVTNIIKSIKWIPPDGLNKMFNMLTLRPDWCISRQRIWGVPIALFVHKKTKKLHPKTDNILLSIIKKVKNEGFDFWYNDNVYSLFNVDSSFYDKVTDVLDVWYDSSVVYKYISDKYFDFKLPYDLYLEGSDQYRGWFQVSLLNSMMLYNKCMSEKILVHGFVLDKFGKKMSKSMGNIIDPMFIVNNYGADILRLWISSVNYRLDINISIKGLDHISDIYKKIRNTFKFLLSNIYDFNPNLFFFNAYNFLKIDIWIINLFKKLEEDVIYEYKAYNFHIVCQKLYSFCINELGSKYFDIVKDRLYTSYKFSFLRQSLQFTLYYIVSNLSKLIAPILTFTSEEILGHIPKNKNISIFMSIFKSYKLNFNKLYLHHSLFLKLLNIKMKLNKILDKYRKNGFIGSSLEADIRIYCSRSLYFLLYTIKNELHHFFIVSNVDLFLFKNFVTSFEIYVKILKKYKCNRCWHRKINHNYFKFISICSRCINNLYGFGEKKRIFF